MEFPANLRYTRSDEWLQIEGDVVTLGITQYATEELGEIVYVELPAIGTSVQKGGECCVVESVKAVGELYAPCAGEIVETNAAVAENSALVNESPYENGWLVKLRVQGEADAGKAAELEDTLSAEEYAAYRA